MSWLYAAFLGIARTWNVSVKYPLMMELYGVAVLVAMTGAVVLLGERRFAVRVEAVPD